MNGLQQAARTADAYFAALASNHAHQRRANRSRAEVQRRLEEHTKAVRLAHRNGGRS